MATVHTDADAAVNRVVGLLPMFAPAWLLLAEHPGSRSPFSLMDRL